MNAKSRIRGHCKCGRCTWQSEMQRDGEMWYHWVLSSAYYTTMDDIGELNYCPVCGCQLTGEGIAYEVIPNAREGAIDDAVAFINLCINELARALELACDGDSDRVGRYLTQARKEYEEAADGTTE